MAERMVSPGVGAEVGAGAAFIVVRGVAGVGAGVGVGAWQIWQQRGHSPLFVPIMSPASCNRQHGGVAVGAGVNSEELLMAERMGVDA